MIHDQVNTFALLNHRVSHSRFLTDPIDPGAGRIDYETWC